MEAIPSTHRLGFWLPNFSMRCSVCGAIKETDLHALLECPLAQEVWAGSCFWDWVKEATIPSVWDLLFQGRDKLEDDEWDVYMATIWEIWSARNKILFWRLVRDVSKLYLRASDFVHAYKEANVQLRVQPEELPGMWSLPPTGIYKVNFDGAKLGEWGHAWGVVIQDGEGDVVVAGV